MYAEDVIYGLYLISALGLVSWTLFRFANILHPHTIFTAIVVVMFMSDFVVRGYSDKVTPLSIPRSDLISYQIAILLICLLLVTGPMWVLRPHRALLYGRMFGLAVSGRHARSLGIAAWSLVILEVLKRLLAVDWSWSNAVSASLSARGTQPWTTALENLGDQTFFYALIGMLLPFSGIVFAYFIARKRGRRQLPSIVGYVAVVALLVVEGTRTPVLFVLAVLGVFYLMDASSTVRKVALLGVVSLVGMILTSWMYLYRGEGLSKIAEGEGDVELVYHQDDSYYKSLEVIHSAYNTSERWDPVYFVYATVVNPIPRYFWPDKPALLQEYWGEYKEYWVTITYIGELVAMFGPILGLALAVPIGWMLFVLLRRANHLLLEPGGIIVYMVVALYVYMVMRSLLNLSQFVYLPLFTYAMFSVARTRSRRLPRIRKG